jgi:hypothetical protein
LAAPTIVPSRSRMGDTDSGTLIRRPSLQTRSLSKWSTRSPRPIAARISLTSSARSAGFDAVDRGAIISSRE